VGKALRAAGMAAVAGQLYRSTRIVTVWAAILALDGRDAITGWMGAFVGFRHKFSDTTSRYIDGWGVKLFLQHH